MNLDRATLLEMSALLSAAFLVVALCVAAFWIKREWEFWRKK